MQHFLFSCILLGLLAFPVHSGEVYTTTGEAGEKVYTDQPVGDARKVTLRNSKAASSAAAPAEEPGPSFEEMSPCEQARHIVRQYDSAEVLAEKTADGETRVLDEAEAAAMKEQARADVERLCKEQNDEQ